MMNMNDSHDSRNDDDDDDIKFISTKDNNHKNILFTPQIPKMERKIHIEKHSNIYNEKLFIKVDHL